MSEDESVALVTHEMAFAAARKALVAVVQLALVFRAVRVGGGVLLGKADGLTSAGQVTFFDSSGNPLQDREIARSPMAALEGAVL